MYKINVPKVWINSENRIVLRILNRNSRESKVHHLVAGREFPLSPSHFPAGSSNEFVIWVDQIHDGKSVPVTERTTPALISQISSLRNLLEQIYFKTSSNDEPNVKNILQIINSSRWISDPKQSDRIYRISDNIFGLVGRAAGSSEAELRNLIESLNAIHPANDGSEIMNNIIYVYFAIKIHKLTNKESVKFFSSLNSIRTGACVAIPDGVREILHEARAYGSHPSVNLLIACLESVFVTRGDSAHRIQAVIQRPPQESQSKILKTSGLGGAATYGSCEEGDETIAIAPVVLEYLHKSVPSVHAQEPTIIYSADPHFLKSYLPRLLFYVSLFPEYRYHFHIIASKYESTVVKDLILKHIQSIVSIRSSEASTPKIDISFSECPADVKERVSYYASARYMIAGEIMKESSRPVWIQDVDLYPTGELSSFLPTFLAHDVSLYRSSFLGGTLPWVRYLAGNVFVSPTSAGMEFLVNVDRYMRHWLTVESSWMIDQNAISYGIESMKSSLLMADTRTMRVPVQQSALANRIENMR